MNYEQRLVAAAKCVYAADSTSDQSPVNVADFGVTASLKPYQVEGVSWLIRRYHTGVNVILGDEMGLGKTLQAISFMSYLKVHQMFPGPFLVLCPLSVTDGWVSEVANFSPKLRVLRYVGDKDHRRNLRRKMHEHVKEVSDVPSLPFDVLLTTFDIALIDQDFLSQIPWHYAVIDEAQRLKNSSSVLYNVLRDRFIMPRRLLMTGTPIQNNLTELWALMHFCMPSILGTMEQFLSAFKKAGDPSSGHQDPEVKELLKILKYVLGAFMLRRTKAKLIDSGTLVLPPLTEITAIAPLVGLQKKVYMSILRKELPKLLAISSGASNHQSLQNIGDAYNGTVDGFHVYYTGPAHCTVHSASDGGTGGVDGVSMNYEQRLVAAAKCVYAADSTGDQSPVNVADFGVTASLKPYQVEGVSWLIRRYHTGVNVILGDEMGLGKTLQAISFMSYLKVHQMSPGPFLVLCPLSVTDGWVSEVANFSPKLRVLRYVGDKDHRRNLRRKMHEHVKEVSDVPSLPFDVLLTTFDIALIDQDFLSQIPWHYAVIDEAQRLKNSSSVLYNVLRDRFIMPRRLLMTGTPIQNNLTELWALMHFCMPSILGTMEQFLSAFKKAGDPSSGHQDPEVKELLKILKYVLGAFMLRRTKAKLIDSGTLVLPPLTEITAIAPLVGLQKKVYMSILRKELPKLLAISSGASNHQSLQNIVIQLRKACSHPYLFPGIEPEPYEEGEHLVQASGKLMILDQLLQRLYHNGHRVLLFAQMTHTLDVLQDFLELRKYSYERLDGSIRAEERFAAIRNFSRQSVKGNHEPKNDPSSAFIFMISTRAGGVGLNLVGADTVIFYEQDWNPQVDKQALQRAHRIGQINHVLSINLVTGRTVEEVIMRRAEKKLQLSHNVVGEDHVDQEGKGTGEPESGDLRSVIFGLHMLDPTDITNEDSAEQNLSELGALAEKLLAVRSKQQLDKDDQKFEVDAVDIVNGIELVKKDPATVAYPDFDEPSYLMWVEKLKEASRVNDSSLLESKNKKILTEEKHQRADAARKKAEENKLAKWESLGYHSLAIKDPICDSNSDMMSDSGSVQFVYGDCTQPSNISSTDPAIIFSCVDNSGTWGHGGMFDALAKLSASVPSAYERASEFKDLHLGDLHLVEIKDDDGAETKHDDAPRWVALAVVQSYSAKRKVPRSSISIPDLERCLSKASFSAAQNSASLHMPRIGYQHSSDRSEWYTVERLLRKYAAMYGIDIFVYYFKRPS